MKKAWNKGLTKETDNRVMKYTLKNAGKKRTIECRKKMSNSHTGIKLSKEHSKKIGLGHKGIKFSNETKEKISKKLLGKNKGKIPWNFIDGRSKNFNTQRYGPGWKKIRTATLIRDNFTCQFCFKTNTKLEIHHKIPFLLTKDNSLENLLTLCFICHKKEETRIMRELKNQEVKTNET